MMKSSAVCVRLYIFTELSARAFGCRAGKGPILLHYKKLHTKPRKIRMLSASDMFITVGEYEIFPWALSGIESSIVVKGPGKKDRIAFDMGYAHREAVRCSDVFISHGHMDHVAGIPHHTAKRALAAFHPKPTYYVPAHLVDPLTTIFNGFSAMNEENLTGSMNLSVIEPGTDVKISNNRFVRAFPTIHRVKSQGYILSRKSHPLKEEYKQLSGSQIHDLVKEGVAIRDEVIAPEIAYTGDSTFEVFLNSPDPDLLKVKILITESTYIDDEIDKQGRGGQQRARERGHMHLQEFIDNAALFENVEKIVLLHFSDKYSLGYVEDKTKQLLEGSPLQDKILLGTIQKQMFPS